MSSIVIDPAVTQTPRPFARGFIPARRALRVAAVDFKTRIAQQIDNGNRGRAESDIAGERVEAELALRRVCNERVAKIQVFEIDVLNVGCRAFAKNA